MNQWPAATLRDVLPQCPHTKLARIGGWPPANFVRMAEPSCFGHVIKFSGREHSLFFFFFFFFNLAQICLDQGLASDRIF